MMLQSLGLVAILPPSIAMNVLFVTGVDAMVDANPAGDLAFSVIGVSRAVQGICAGMLFVIVQVLLECW